MSTGRPSAVGWRWRTYPGLPSAAGLARQYISRGLVTDPAMAETAAQLVGELFANALTHTASGRLGGIVWVGYVRHAHGVRVVVRDQGAPHGPELRKAEPDDENGRGVLLMDALADQWGESGDHEGRSVWFDLLPAQHNGHGSHNGTAHRPGHHQASEPQNAA